MALASGPSRRRSLEARLRLRNSRSAAAIVLLTLLLGAGCNSWRGPGFRASGPELPRLRQVLAIAPGGSVADVGAGKGELTVALATEVGPSGRVYSTEIDPESLEQIRAAVAAARLENVTLVQARADETGLPVSCCDAIVLRRVYHHLTDPAAINASLLRSLRPGGVLAVIDSPPLLSWLWPWPPAGVPRSRGGHGVDARVVTKELVASGFELVQVIEDWPGRWPLASYCAVFRKPRDAPPGRPQGSRTRGLTTRRADDEP
jgi:SAM-dependent methyltransferase